MNLDIEAYLTDAGRTLDFAPDAPRALHERLRFVAALLREAGPLASGPKLVFRDPAGVVWAAPVAGAVVVGREAPATLAVRAPRLSRQHFRIVASAALEDRATVERPSQTESSGEGPLPRGPGFASGGRGGTRPSRAGAMPGGPAATRAAIGLLEDLDSRNGTWVNGVRVARRNLLDGDAIEAGGLTFVYLGA